MADLLQKHLRGTTRAAVEADLEIGEVGWNEASTQYELIIENIAGNAWYHFASLERFDDITASASGASLIGVEDNSWSNLTGDQDLQLVLDDLDTLLDSVILSDASVNMTEDWACEKGLTVNSTSGAFDFVVNGDTVANVIKVTGATDVLTIELKDNTSTIFKIAEGARGYYSINTTNGSEQVSYGDANSAPKHSFEMDASDALAFRIGVDTQDWFIIDTSTPKIDIGNAAADPAYNFLGDGNVIGHFVFDTSAPPNPVNGSSYVDQAGHRLYIHDGTNWDYIDIVDADL